MRLKGLMAPLVTSEKFLEIQSCVNSDKTVEIKGLSDSGKGYLLSSVFESINKSMVIITHSDLEAKNLYEDMNLYMSNVFYFPSKEIVFYNIDAISGDLRWARLNVIKEMISKRKNIIITSIESFATRYTPKSYYSSNYLKISVSKELDFENLIEKLVQGGYERTFKVEGKGEFSVHGGILDVYPADSVYPYRIEFFGDEVESIRTFNVESQRSIDNVQKVEIFPAKEVIIDDEAKKMAIDNIKNNLNEVIKNAKGDSRKERLNKIVHKNLEDLQELGSFQMIESYLPFFYSKANSLFDYLKDYVVVVDEKDRAMGKLDSIYEEFNQNYTMFLERGDILPGQLNLLFDKEQVIQLIDSNANISLASIMSSSNFLSISKELTLETKNLSGYQGQLELLINDIKEKKQSGFRTVILSGTRTRGERLVDTLRERDIESRYSDKVDDIAQNEVVITFGNLLAGFQCDEYKICVISDKDVFGEAKRKLSKRKKNKKGIGKIKSFEELKVGDYVVHASHGIGVYKGIKQIEALGHKRDYLEIVYEKGDKLYVPVDQLDIIQKYVGSEGKTPKVNKLGSSEWKKSKARAKKSINEIAEDLVKLYATRSAIKGYKFSKDTQWQRQFEDEFPFEETPDQIVSIDEIKSDMQSDKVMDRLLCGDVGYGKTEVALRAAFKAVMDGKQVAFLVPTTILAEQHYKNAKKRFSDFPVKIDMLSRFRTSKQQKETLKALKEGNVDLLIGTHRLVSKDIQFKDLGLLIVDEEQRFGVTQKEKIKNVKKNVDVLTLSATPIPRTLHMSLTGVRDISVIETPPEERYPIQTYVVEQNDQLIRDAIIREKSRGGQVYFVYNRVETIDKMANYIKELVPECSISVVHGQMTERQLEKEMLSFMNKEADILVCTTIIETGMDIQNVNTIIVNDADKMGLSQLYQLRGRVGRSNRIAYAYLMYTKDKILTEIAEKRLKALKDFTELGSGFKIAMRDLEIRGAGNMVGSSQHGHMAAIGYDLYCKMLEDTIKLIKGEDIEEDIDTSVDLKVDAYIPSEYIQDEMQKIEVYKKIAAIENQDEYFDIKEELEDRYSEIPISVYNLMDIAYLKNDAKRMRIEEIKEDDFGISFYFIKDNKDYGDIFKRLVTNYKDKIILQFGTRPRFILKENTVEQSEKLRLITDMLSFIVDSCKKLKEN